MIKKLKVDLYTVLKTAFMLILIFYFVCYLKNNWADFRQFLLQLPSSVFIMSVFVMLIGQSIRGFLWAPIFFEIVGKPMGWWNAYYISAVSRLGRYVPGKVWVMVSKTALSSKDSEDLHLSGLASVFDNLYAEALLFFFGISAIVMSGHIVYFTDDINFIYVVAAALLLIICIEPHILKLWLNVLLKIFKKPLLSKTIALKKTVGFGLVNLIAIALWSLSYLIIINNYVSLDYSQMLGLAGVNAMAWFLGFIALIAPAGIGVRESINIFGLSNICNLTLAEAMVIVVTYRIVSIIGDIFSVLLSVFLKLMKII